MPDAARIVHQTPQRLRLALPAGASLDAAIARLRAVAGVHSVRPVPRLHGAVVRHDGRAGIVSALQHAAAAPPAAGAGRTGLPPRQAPTDSPRSLKVVADTAAAALAMAAPWLPGSWARAASLSAVGARVAGRPLRWRDDGAATLLDAAALSALALGGQAHAVSASVLLRLLAEGLSARLVQQADSLLANLLPTLASDYHVLREAPASGEAGAPALWQAMPLRGLRAGDRIRLYGCDVVPVDGHVVDGEARVQPLGGPAAGGLAQDHDARAGNRLLAGERLVQGTVVLQATGDVEQSRLQRLRRQLAHTIQAREPAGRLSHEQDRLLSVPLLGGALIWAFTRDTGRAAAALQADPQQGLDLARPVVREAALAALARHGLLSNGLESVDRLARADTLVLQDTGVLACGSWRLDRIALTDIPGSGPGLAGPEAARRRIDIRAWIAALAGLTVPALDGAGVPDATVRQWLRHGAVLPLGDREIHLASPRRLRALWGLPAPADAAADSAGTAVHTQDSAGLRRRLALVAGGRVLAWVVMVSAWRDTAARHIDTLRALGFSRVALWHEDDGEPEPDPAQPACPAARAADLRLTERLPDSGERLVDLAGDGRPLVLLHTTLRDRVAAGSLSLTPLDAEAGAHGVLLGDPLASLVAARSLAGAVQRRLAWHHGTALTANTVLMTASALQRLSPLATTLLHHALAFAVLLDSLRVERLSPEPANAPAPLPASTGHDTP